MKKVLLMAMLIAAGVLALTWQVEAQPRRVGFAPGGSYQSAKKVCQNPATSAQCRQILNAIGVSTAAVTSAGDGASRSCSCKDECGSDDCGGGIGGCDGTGNSCVCICSEGKASSIR